jgi:hypothetical protein
MKKLLMILLGFETGKQTNRRKGKVIGQLCHAQKTGVCLQIFGCFGDLFESLNKLGRRDI